MLTMTLHKSINIIRRFVKSLQVLIHKQAYLVHLDKIKKKLHKWILA
jgi:hypothetical protein